jgi:hypothetical protein
VKKLPAYSKSLISRRKLGERIGLLIVAVHDWEAGRDLEARSGTARIVVAEDCLPHELDWAPAVALDCLVVGECQESVFYATVTMLHAAGAASIWGEYSTGILRIEQWKSKCCPTGFYTVDPPVSIEKFSAELRRYRELALVTRLGNYANPIFATARLAAFRNVFGDKAEVVQEMLDKRMAA